MNIKDKYDGVVFPKAVLFDWHGTVANTLQSMYHAFDDMLKVVDSMIGLDKFLHSVGNQNVDVEDRKLIQYILDHKQLHPKVVNAGKVSRTDLFSHILKDDKAVDLAHKLFDECYRDHCGEVLPMEEGILDNIKQIKQMGIKIGLVTNRQREFIEKELIEMEMGKWKGVFEVVVAAGDAKTLKPSPEPLAMAVHKLGMQPSKHIWYVGDSHADIKCAKATNPACTSVFYNGADWSKKHLERRYNPEFVVDNMDDLRNALERIAERDNINLPKGLSIGR